MMRHAHPMVPHFPLEERTPARAPKEGRASRWPTSVAVVSRTCMSLLARQYVSIGHAIAMEGWDGRMASLLESRAALSFERPHTRVMDVMNVRALTPAG
jgi:hypothetical protein